MVSWGAGLLAVAGSAGEGAGQVIKEQAKDERLATIEAKKQDALLARQKNLARYSADLQAEGRREQNAWDAKEAVLASDRSLSNAQTLASQQHGFDQESAVQKHGFDVELTNISADRNLSNAQALAQQKYGFDKDLLSHKAQLKTTNPQYKTSDLKYMQENALKSLHANLLAKGAILDTESGSIVIPTDKQGMPDVEVLTMLDQSGFEFKTGKNFKEDKKGLFTGDNHYVTIHLGGFDPGRINSNSYSQMAENPSDLFDKYHTKAQGSNFTSPQNTESAPRSAAIEQQSVSLPVQNNQGILSSGQNNSEMPTSSGVLPDNPEQWNVKTVNKNGKPTLVAIVDGREILLTDDEVRAYNLSMMRSGQSGYDYVEPAPDAVKFPGFKKRPND